MVYDSGDYRMGSQFQFCVVILELLLPLHLVPDLVLCTNFYRKAYSLSDLFTLTLYNTLMELLVQDQRVILFCFTPPSTMR